MCYYIEIITNWIIVDKDNKPHYQAIFNADKMLSGVCALLLLVANNNKRGFFGLFINRRCGGGRQKARNLR